MTVNATDQNHFRSVTPIANGHDSQWISYVKWQLGLEEQFALSKWREWYTYAFQNPWARSKFCHLPTVPLNSDNFQSQWIKGTESSSFGPSMSISSKWNTMLSSSFFGKTYAASSDASCVNGVSPTVIRSWPIDACWRWRIKSRQCTHRTAPSYSFPWYSHEPLDCIGWISRREPEKKEILARLRKTYSRAGTADLGM